MMSLLDLPGCVVFECVGVPGVLDSIFMGCERGTSIFSAGGPPEGDHMHTMVAKRKGLNIQFGGGPSMTHWNEAFREVCAGRIDVTPMFGWTVGLGGVPSAIEAARNADGPARIIVVPSLEADPDACRHRRHGRDGPAPGRSPQRAPAWTSPLSPAVPRAALSSKPRECHAWTTWMRSLEDATS